MANEPGNSFYTEVPADQLTQTGEKQPEATRRYIADPETAHDIALVQDQEGMVAARAREDYLRKTHEAGGYTPEQMENIKLMEGLQKQFPDAFDIIVTQKGNKLLLSRPVPQKVIQKVYEEQGGMNIGFRQLLTPDGFINIANDGIVDLPKERFDQLLVDADFTEITDLLAERGKLYDVHTFLTHKKSGGSIGVNVYSWGGKDLIDNVRLLANKKTTFTEAGNAHTTVQEQEAKHKVSTEDVLKLFDQAQ